MEVPKNFLTTKQVQNRYNVSRHTILRWRRKGLDYYTTVNKYVYFDPADIKRFIKENYTPTLKQEGDE